MTDIHTGDIHGSNNFNQGVINITYIQNIIDKSKAYQELLAQQTTLNQERDKLRKRIEKYPDDEEFVADLRQTEHKLQETEQNIKDFQRDVIKLAEDFQRIELNTERLQQAYAYFQQGEFDKARTVLDTEAMQSEQTRLLEQKDKLARQTAENEKALAHNAQEWLLKARLIALDYSLKEQRIAQARAAFETALKSERSADNLFQYAYFLQENNQYYDAVSYYEEVLAISRKLAQQQPEIFTQYVATTLNNLANLLAKDPSLHSEAEKYYGEALAIRRKLAQQQPEIFTRDVATTLNNLANLLSHDPSRRSKAEAYYREVLAIRRKLAQQQPEIFEQYVANTLNNLANLLQLDLSRHSDAEQYYGEALTLYRKLAQQQTEIFEQYVADTLNNLANLLAKDSSRRSKAEAYYDETLTLYRKLAQLQPDTYQPQVANTLTGFALLYCLWNKPAAARPLAEEAAALIAPYAENYPQYYGGLQQAIQNLLNKLP